MNKNKKGSTKIFAVVIAIVAVGVVGYFVTIKKQTPVVQQTNETSSSAQISTPRHLEAFEKALNEGNFVEAEKYFTDNVVVLLEGSSCCGQVSKNNVLQELQRVKGTTFNFNADNLLLQEYQSYNAEQYPDGRIINKNPKINFDELVFGSSFGVNQIDKTSFIGYKVSNGKISTLFIDEGVDKKQNNQAITVLSPNGGERLIRGKEYLIKWTSNLQSSVPIRISFVKNSFVAKDIYKEFNPKTANSQYEGFTDSIYPNPIPNTGNYIYKIPNGISTGDNWQIMIWSGQSCSVWRQEKKCDFDFSDNFFSFQ